MSLKNLKKSTRIPIIFVWWCSLCTFIVLAHMQCLYILNVLRGLWDSGACSTHLREMSPGPTLLYVLFVWDDLAVVYRCLFVCFVQSKCCFGNIPWLSGLLLAQLVLIWYGLLYVHGIMLWCLNDMLHKTVLRNKIFVHFTPFQCCTKTIKIALYVLVWKSYHTCPSGNDYFQKAATNYTNS